MTAITYTVLTNADKLETVKSHIRNEEYNAYNNEISLLEAESAAVIDSAVVDSITLRMLDSAAKLTALISKKVELEAAIAAAPKQ